MLRTSFRTHNFQIASAVWSSLLFLVPSAALAQAPEGRQTAPLAASGNSYERKRIKHTVPLETLQGWDLLYDTPEGRVYFDWDDQFLYLAVESKEPQDIRFDLDASGDGWFRGAENFSIRLVTSPEGAKALIRRFDTVQNKEHPVWAEVLLPEGSVQARQFKTAQGSGMVVAVPCALLGPQRKPGTEFGFRALLGAAALAEPTAELPLVRLQLTDESEAILGTLAVRMSLRDRNLVTGGLVRGTLELSNSGEKPLFLKQIFLPDGTTITNPKDPSLILNPGERLRREFRFVLGEGPEPASIVLRAGAEREEGGSAVALGSVDRQEPFLFALDHDAKPLVALAPDGPQRRRLLVATITGRRDSKTVGQVRLALPAGWTVEGEDKRTFSVSYPNERRSVSFKLIVPLGVPAGSYPVEAQCEIGGKTYRAKVEFLVK
ncbi:NEW3 domain-containing protein [Armatimonas sp.]|uniref:NEW3 domain-containing protein n=1 Tax=Armatimonas sp. TaxID=1872638 RepID=UPI00286C0EFC|nr:NEW3 domain-containing protein [Armatimonas sp.]